ncbi:MAG: hypothetical protein ACLFNC_05935, partial [Halodesulfurarchaeum sp.]
MTSVANCHNVSRRSLPGSASTERVSVPVEGAIGSEGNVGDSKPQNRSDSRVGGDRLALDEQLVEQLFLDG